MPSLLNGGAGGEKFSRWPAKLENCHSRECPHAARFWRRVFDAGAMVKLHDSHFCFPTCFEHELLLRVERSRRWTPRQTTANSRHVPIGLLMLARGNLTNDQLQQALDQQKRAGRGRIGEWLSEMGFAQERDIMAALAMQWSCPVVRKLPYAVNDCGLPLHLSRTFRLVPLHLSRTNSTLHIAFADRIAYPALVVIEQMLQVKTEPCLTTERELSAALALMEDGRRPMEKKIGNVRGPEEIVRIISGYTEKLRASEVRLSACDDLFWCRIFGDKPPTDLIFPRDGVFRDQSEAF